MIRKLTPILFAALFSMPTLTSAENWPGWRGPERTDISKETGLLKSWPEGGPKQLWMNNDIGLGYSSFAVVDDSLYTMGAREDQEYLIAVNVENGKEKWSQKIGPLLKNNWGDGPRGTPTVDGDFVYAMNGQGYLICVQKSDGKVIWETTMKKFGGRKPGWGYCESVLIDGENLICTPGGKEGALIALNKTNGELIWQSKDFTEGAQYASVILAEHAGKKQYIQLTQKKLVGVDAATGDVLWTSNWSGRTAVIPTPIFHQGYVYITSGYGVGCKLVKLDEKQKPSDVYVNKVMKNHHGGVILLGDHLFGYSDGPGWVCQNFLSGEQVWNNKKDLGKGSLTYAEGHFYCLDRGKGTVALVEASKEKWIEKGRFTLKPQSTKRKPSGKIWTHPVVANGKLYLRDQELLFCFDIKAK